jgi:hypothetical protein
MSVLPFYGRVLIRPGTDGHKVAASGPLPVMSVLSHINYSLVTSRKEPFVCRLSEITLKAARLWERSDRQFTFTVGAITDSSPSLWVRSQTAQGKLTAQH